ncbi:Hypothetical predicted protein [Marmota monax]|uniref:Uncharacterized protein n=1 Tax=Marmota monax TaxID=9995 RepID=A0A5E4AL40_MARMO|nr:hypothetical protein GHT09_019336 [Marmota monax]VTJ58163.1 Hypothetical predicted protein [Marmota monax]
MQSRVRTGLVILESPPGCGLDLSPPAPCPPMQLFAQPASCPSQRKAPKSPVVLCLGGQRPLAGPPRSGSAERGRESPGRMSALGAGHSAGGGCNVAAALGPAEALGTEERELPGTLRQMWRYRSWDVPQIPAEAPQAQ